MDWVSCVFSLFVLHFIKTGNVGDELEAGRL